jgi:3-deoxy-D-manno-octulosonate 8-phosphate phosphatase (KDO 8-P phosphatase)
MPARRVARTQPNQFAGLRARARRIQLLLMDVDGVLTDGRIYLLGWPNGAVSELKVFHAQDGAALKLARELGLRTGIITGRLSAATEQRAREIGIEFLCQNAAAKLPAYRSILQQAGLEDTQVAYIGDDLPDLPVLRCVGLAVAVNNAVLEVKRAAHYVTRCRGGEGAVREVVELLLRARGQWSQLLRLLREGL